MQQVSLDLEDDVLPPVTIDPEQAQGLITLMAEAVLAVHEQTGSDDHEPV